MIYLNLYIHNKNQPNVVYNVYIIHVYMYVLNKNQYQSHWIRTETKTASHPTPTCVCDGTCTCRLREYSNGWFRCTPLVTRLAGKWTFRGLHVKSHEKIKGAKGIRLIQGGILVGRFVGRILSWHFTRKKWWAKGDFPILGSSLQLKGLDVFRGVRFGLFWGYWVPFQKENIPHFNMARTNAWEMLPVF